jgi:hypothetical protein
MPGSWHRRPSICLGRPLSRLGSGCRRPPAQAWRSIGRMATRAAGHSAGCVMLAPVPPVMKSEERADASRGSLSRGLRRCCRCTRLRRGLNPFPLLAATRLVSFGTMVTKVGSTHGISFAVIAFARSVKLFLKSDGLGLRPPASVAAELSLKSGGSHDTTRVSATVDCQDF